MSESRIIASNMNRSVCVVIPVWNEGKVIRKTIQDVLKVYPFVVCVNDGSKDNSANEIKKTSAVLVEHPINMGQGAALQTGIEYGLQYPEVEYFVTFDADGQHSITDVQKMHKTLKSKQYDIALGSRFMGTAINMPGLRRIAFRLAILFTSIFSGIRLSDAHNGLRMFTRDFAEKLHMTMPGMAHASEIVDKVGRGKWRYVEVPVTIHYTDYSRAKGQSALNSVNVLLELLFSRVGR